MAQPSTEVNNFRGRVNGLMQSLRDLDEILAIVEDQGADDAARRTFFESVFAAEYDITWNQFAAGVVALRAMRTARDTNKLAIAKLLI